MCQPARFKAFTLGELLVAFVVVALALLGLVSVEIYAFRAQTKVNLRNAASVIAANQMNRAQRDLQQAFNLTSSARAEVPDNPTYEFALAETAVGGSAELADVVVSVYWSDANGPQEFDLWTRSLKE